MKGKWTYEAFVRGTIHFPDFPDHEGTNGLVGGEDVYTIDRKFPSRDAAMDWVRQVLDYQVEPKWEGAGELPSQTYDGPNWQDGIVTAHNAKLYDFAMETNDYDLVHTERWAATEMDRDWRTEGVDGARIPAVIVRSDPKPE